LRAVQARHQAAVHSDAESPLAQTDTINNGETQDNRPRYICSNIIIIIIIIVIIDIFTVA